MTSVCQKQRDKKRLYQENTVNKQKPTRAVSIYDKGERTLLKKKRNST